MKITRRPFPARTPTIILHAIAARYGRARLVPDDTLVRVPPRVRRSLMHRYGSPATRARREGVL